MHTPCVVVCISLGLKNISNDGAREMEFGSLDGGEDGKYSGVSFVVISKIFSVHDASFLGIERFDGV